MMNQERKQWLREKLDEFTECHLMNFGDSGGWDVHGDLCDLLAQNAALLEALTKLDNYLDAGYKIKPNSRIHDLIQKAIAEAKEK